MPIRVEKLSHSYKMGTPFEKQVLFDIDLEIHDGEFVGLIGPTQAGKTTLAQHFNGLYIPKTGKVFVDNQDISDKKVDIVAIRHKVGYVFQSPEHQLFKETVGEDIAFGPSNQGCSKEEIEKRVRDNMALVGLDHKIFAKRDIFALSGGQKRRAAIAGVLACNPRVLVLDDPTAGLDRKGREDILTVIDRLHREKSITIVFISNSMDDVARLAERIVVMDQGRIFMDGSTKEVFGQADKLIEIGLGVPQTVDIMHRLNAKGYKVHKNILQVEEAAEEILKGLKASGGEEYGTN
jgi:energy-coupling factor transport system ATP-binding protein